MSLGFIVLTCVVALLVIAFVIIKFVRIVPKCPQCESVGDIYDSNVSEAWLDCRCLSCNYNWRIE